MSEIDVAQTYYIFLQPSSAWWLDLPPLLWSFALVSRCYPFIQSINKENNEDQEDYND
jgi:hypothetical protein